MTAALKPLLGRARPSRAGLRLGVALALTLLPTIGAQAQRTDARVGPSAAIAVFEFRGMLAGLAVGPTLRAAVTESDGPLVEAEVGVLLAGQFNDDRMFITGPRARTRGLGPVGLVRVGLVWPVSRTGHGAYIGGGIVGYFPGSRSDILPGAAGGVEAAIGSRGAWGTGLAYVEIRAGYLNAGAERPGHTLQMLVGALY